MFRNMDIGEQKKNVIAIKTKLPHRDLTTSTIREIPNTYYKQLP